MNTIPSGQATQTHPLILVAAAAVTIASGVVIANLAGWLPEQKPQTTQTAPEPVSTPAPVAAVAEPVAPPKPAAPKKVVTGGTAHLSAPPASKTPTVAAIPPDYRLPSTPPPPAVKSEIAREMVRIAPPVCRDCGTVEAIEEVPVEGKAGAGGAIAGGVVGSILGNQMGEGSGRTAARLLGMAGGAYVGHQIEKSGNKSVRYDVTVRFDDGTSQRVVSNTPPAWRNGDKVRIQNGEIVPRN